MAIINDYSMKMVVKDNLEQILNILLQNREFALLTVDMEGFLKDGKYRCEVDHFKYGRNKEHWESIWIKGTRGVQYRLGQVFWEYRLVHRYK